MNIFAFLLANQHQTMIISLNILGGKITIQEEENYKIVMNTTLAPAAQSGF